MSFAIFIIFVVIAVVVIAAVVRSRKPESSGSGDVAASHAPQPDPDEFNRFRPPYREFHVDGREALVTFEVPLGPDGADEALSSLLVKEAVEVTREKQREGATLGGIETVKAYGRRAGKDVFVGEVEIAVSHELPEIGLVHVELHDVDVHADLPMSATAGSTAMRAEGDRLEPVAEIIELTSGIESGLRAQGVDPETMTAGDLVIGLLWLSGHQVTEAGEPNTYLARRAGVSLYVAVVDHVPGSYPELDEAEMRGFAADFRRSRQDRGWLVTEKFGPYAVYDSEKRMPEVRFLTRERLQSVVDGFSLS